MARYIAHSPNETMKCLGRTKTSKFRKRCTNKATFLFCWQHVWQPFTVIFTLFLIGAAVSAISGYSLRDIWEWNQKNIKPDIACSMEYPIKVQDDKVFRNKKNPDC